ncbi:hypothetical protein CVIRNUC_000448 [Coccomyxa viridis]|uniref:Uncharacterized protein n=1 Tax=Coccomyxa viridis TaxID=1274662 RepID=A0AAV1HQG7_9CHLO|nr:hypothetical protein CVIRNUC_000448 [Coccomyxa viridis]
MSQDPDAMAMLLVQQYLDEMGYSSALHELERQHGLKFVPDKLPKGSMLLEMIYERMEKEAAEADEPEVEARQRELAEEEALLKGGSQNFQMEHVECIDNLHETNIISVCCWPGPKMFFTGSGNGQVQQLTYSGDLYWSKKLPVGGILSLDIWINQGGNEKAVLLVGAMDGSVSILDAEEGYVLSTAKAHTKYCVQATWNSSGTGFITASWDQSLSLYEWSAAKHVQEGSQAAEEPKLRHREAFPTAVTAAAYLPNGNIVIALRSSNYLRLFDPKQLKEVGRINMNAQGDDHVSFSAAHLALRGKYLLVSTDGPRIIMYNTEDWQQRRNFFGLPVEKFHQPVALWHPSGHYIIAAAAHGYVYVFHVGTAKVVQSFKAHEKNVRSLDYDASNGILVTGSFDKKCQIWKDSTTPG